MDGWMDGWIHVAFRQSITNLCVRAVLCFVSSRLVRVWIQLEMVTHICFPSSSSLLARDYAIGLAYRTRRGDGDAPYAARDVARGDG